ncbi:hypothetical protein EIP91_007122 [Steccherinum ochraceum]|uniref:CxC2-like cysteine cluster KDZ transposase-associated domain-containing protein n=1 Tax=Steccherinum ochraceum TaxID=92696 RepID=A0A4R0RIY6_9APHY|nr:hypothetical protein EIP91_007122 [Steccherinum ochraceum]
MSKYFSAFARKSNKTTQAFGLNDTLVDHSAKDWKKNRAPPLPPPTANVEELTAPIGSAVEDELLAQSADNAQTFRVTEGWGLDAEDEDNKGTGGMLIDNGFWPGSWTIPQTAFTFGVMDMHEQMTRQAQMSTLDFWEYLRRRTDIVRQDDLPDRYRELLTAAREWQCLGMAKRQGLDSLHDLQYGSLAVVCPACPQVTKNMDPGWRQRKEEDKFLDAFFYAKDGNFRSNQKQKDMDPLDFPLTKGAAYFANEDAFNFFVKTTGTDDAEVSTCHQFGAMGHGYRWGKISGIFTICCSRHMFTLPGGIVDLELGEKHLDERLSKLFKRIKREPQFKDLAAASLPETTHAVPAFHGPAHQERCRFCMSFTYLEGSGRCDGEAPERTHVPSNAAADNNREMSDGHRHDSINLDRGDQNAHKVHRMPLELLRKHILAVDQEAEHKKELNVLEESIRKYLADYTLTSWNQELQKWYTEVRDFRNHDTMIATNPFVLNRAKLLPKEISVPEVEVAATDAEDDPLATAIKHGVDLEVAKAKLVVDIRLCDKTEATLIKMEDEKAHLERKVKAWYTQYEAQLLPLMTAAAEDAKVVRVDIRSASSGDAVAALQLVSDRDTRIYRELSEDYGLIHSEVLELTGDDDDTSPVEIAGQKRKRSELKLSKFSRTALERKVHDIDIRLPSSTKAVVLGQEHMQTAVALELEIRKDMSRRQLDHLRTELITLYALTRDRTNTLSGQTQMTRSAKKLTTRNRAVKTAAAAYRRSYTAMRCLGLSPKDQEFRPLKANEVKSYPVGVGLAEPKKTKTKEGSKTLTKPRARPVMSWIWGGVGWSVSVDESIQEHAYDAVKVQWFRMSANAARWREERMLVEEEMRRTARFFLVSSRELVDDAQLLDREGNVGKAAYFRKRAYRFERLLDLCNEKWDTVRILRGLRYTYNGEHIEALQYKATPDTHSRPAPADSGPHEV